MLFIVPHCKSEWHFAFPPMFLSWGTWPTGQNFVLKFTCSGNCSLLTWYGKQVFPLKSITMCASPCCGMMRIRNGDRWEEMSDDPNSEPWPGGSETVKSERWIFLNRKQLVFRDIWISCWMKPIVKYVIAEFQTHYHLFHRWKIPSLKRATYLLLHLWAQNIEESDTAPHLELERCLSMQGSILSDAQCPMIHNGSWRHFSFCLMLSTFLSTGFFHSFLHRQSPQQTELLTRHHVFSYLSNTKAWSFCKRVETSTLM